MTDNLSRLDDEDYPAVSMGQAAQLLDVQPAFLRSLDAAGILSPFRTDGGHRRFSRRQLRLATRLRELLDGGHSLLSAQTILGLEQQLDVSESARHRADRARDDATDARDDARADLRQRDDELAATRAQLTDARNELTELRGRLASHGEG
ncbi:helix-turn-helix domain-containing protein [Pseudonocardia sp. N23]|uniref:helix-turn-helix domain-containing protein n=1 Tax=Pseudonocardia sp. N23 TaxID=1987376 RepID=UPI000C03356B|nr:HspR, transcriptional repressor of DnaK operon [Pseudonocardia sp. N23]